MGLRLALRRDNWCVLEATILSDHRCNEFRIVERRHPVNTERDSKRRNSSWNTRRLNKEKLREHLEETRLIDGHD